MKTGKDITGPVNLGNPTEFTILELAKKDHRDDRFEVADSFSSFAQR